MSGGAGAVRRTCWSQANLGQRWTREDLIKLQVMLNAGYRPRDIAVVLNRSIESIVAKANRERIHLPQRRSSTSGRFSRF
jgi:hypothetical protein